jgi:hypothetical protein
VGLREEEGTTIWTTSRRSFCRFQLSPAPAPSAAAAAEPYSEPMVVQQVSVILECARDAEGEPTTYGLLIRRVAGRQAIVVESVDAHSPNLVAQG